MTQPVITSLHRYPVKGLSAQSLPEVMLTPGETLPFDRAYAIENGLGPFDPEAPRHLPKLTFLCLMRNERLATLTTAFSDQDQTLEIKQGSQVLATGDLRTQEGKGAIESFMAEFMASDLRGRPRIVAAPGHSFSDVREKCVHIINLASVRALAQAMGRPIDPLRFRANIAVDGLEAWAELDWAGRDITLGDTTVHVFKRTVRCAATEVDPATGARDALIPDALAQTLGHRDFGVYAVVTSGGMIKPGDRVGGSPG